MPVVSTSSSPMFGVVDAGLVDLERVGDNAAGRSGDSAEGQADQRAGGGAGDRYRDRRCGRADEASEAFEGLFRRYAARVYGYARLRCAPETADDVVADTFATAWRLRAQIPDDALPWLLVVARNALANRNRAATRATRLTVAMASVERLAHHGSSAEDVVVDREGVLAALAGLADDERDALLLTAWDGLSQSNAARVAGCSERTFARRLRRARQQLQRISKETS